MDAIQDRIFGDLNTLDNRVKRHQQARSGVRHTLSRIPMHAQPGDAVLLRVTTSGPERFRAVRCWYTIADSNPIGEGAQTIDFERVSVTWDHVLWGYYGTWEAVIPPQDEGVAVRYKIGATTSGGNWQFADNQASDLGAGTDFAYLVTASGVPDWAHEALVYHIFIDRFDPGAGKDWLAPADPSGFYGGTLRGIIERLDYIRDLGFNTIWLSPFFPSPSHHGYDATDYKAVEPRLGTKADLQELIAGAHKRGLRVILDFVANHWSHLHPTFLEAQADRDSPYHDWYLWNNWPADYDTYFDVKNMPKLNLNFGSPARTYLLEIAQDWLRQGVDGYRLDYANGVPDDFWIDFKQACRAVDPACWLIGEIVHTADRQASYLGALDGILDFHLAYALRQTFAVGNWGLDKFEAFLNAHESFFSDEFGRPGFLDNHDMNRFIFLAGGDTEKLKLAALVLFSLAQPPIVYYGTEVGVTQERPIHQGNIGLFEEARLPMKWSRILDNALLAYFRTLISLRRETPVLSYGQRQLAHLDDASNTYAYIRESGAERAVVALNLSDRSQSITIAISMSPDAADRLNQQRVYVNPGEVVVHLAPQSGALII
jgi:glycosidase